MSFNCYEKTPHGTCKYRKCLPMLEILFENVESRAVIEHLPSMYNVQQQMDISNTKTNEQTSKNNINKKHKAQSQTIRSSRQANMFEA